MSYWSKIFIFLPVLPSSEALTMAIPMGPMLWNLVSKSKSYMLVKTALSYDH